MANCRVQNLSRICGYTAQGVEKIYLLDFEDFGGFRFEGDARYQGCIVKAIYRTGEFIEVAAPDVFAKYSFDQTGNIYTHSLETFLAGLDGDLLGNLNLATKRRQIVLFRAIGGKYFVFGYEAGAIIKTAGQTVDNTGAVMTATAASIYPLFEVLPGGMDDAIGFEFLPDFINGAYCETD